jgi:hypothetical protein
MTSSVDLDRSGGGTSVHLRYTIAMRLSGIFIKEATSALDSVSDLITPRNERLAT